MGAAFAISYDDAEIRAAMTRLREFPGARAAAAEAAIGGKMVSATQLRFAGEVGPDGVKWKPSERVVKHGGKTLQLHGYLLGSQVYNVLDGAAGVEWGSPLVYAAAMQGGASFTVYARSQNVFRSVVDGAISGGFVKKSKSNFAQHATIGEHKVNIPARPYLGVNSDDAVEIEDTLALHMQAAILGVAPGQVST